LRAQRLTNVLDSCVPVRAERRRHGLMAEDANPVGFS
jgi:hypothetical protein